MTDGELEDLKLIAAPTDGTRFEVRQDHSFADPEP